MAERRFGDGKRSAGDPLVVSSFFAEPIPEHLTAALEFGALVSLSLSRDGQAFAITITYEGEWDREWFRTPVDACLWLEQELGLLEDEVRKAPPPAERERRRRRR